MLNQTAHPGQYLRGELGSLGATLTEFARQIAVLPNRVTQIIGGKKSVTGDTALRFERWFGTNLQFWLRLESQYDIDVAKYVAGQAIKHLLKKFTLQNLPAAICC